VKKFLITYVLNVSGYCEKAALIYLNAFKSIKYMKRGAQCPLCLYGLGTVPVRTALGHNLNRSHITSLRLAGPSPRKRGRRHHQKDSKQGAPKSASQEPQREKAEPDDQRTQAPQRPGGRRSHRNGGTKAASGKEPQSHHKKTKKGGGQSPEPKRDCCTKTITYKKQQNNLKKTVLVLSLAVTIHKGKKAVR
jgi:hypothetical protein